MITVKNVSYLIWNENFISRCNLKFVDGACYGLIGMLMVVEKVLSYVF